jgi:Cd2+/Zn2+-exporting ATPase
MHLLPGVILFASGLGIKYLMSGSLAWVEPTVFLAAYVLTGWSVLATGLRSILTKGQLDEFVLMSLATVGALAIGAYAEAVAVMLFYRVGEAFQDSAVRRSRQSVASLLQLRPDTARVVEGSEVALRDPAQVQVGQSIQIHPGERIPLDGTVIKGQSRADTSALTGESHPRPLKPGDGILSGMVNLSGLLTVRVDKPLAQSTVSIILDLVQNAAQNKAPTEQFMTRVARVYTPVVVGLASLIAFGPVLAANIPGTENLFASPPQLQDWVYRGLVFLVISCPCALVISIPLGFFAGIGAGSRQGILIKGANFLEALNRVKTVVWDKTGTLTQGRFAVHSVHPEDGFSRKDVLSFASAAERHSSHPIAQAIVREAGSLGAGEKESGIWSMDSEEDKQKPEIKDQRSDSQDQRTEGTGERVEAEVEEVSGQGVQAVIKGQTIMVGREAWIRSRGVSLGDEHVGQPGIWVAVDNKPAGRIVVRDLLRPQAGRAVQGLKKLGLTQYMLTGDNKDTAEEIGLSLGLDGVQAELLPQDKVAKLEAIMARGRGRGYTAFVGDGINDAPVLARSDIGIAMGGLGSDAAIEAADVVLMEDDPDKLVQAVSLAGRTRDIVWQNIGMAMGVKALVMGFGALGLASMWAAVFADVGVALLAVGNSLRILR